MAKKALLVTTVSGFVPQFEMNNVQLLQNLGYEVHYAANYHMPSYGSNNHRLDGSGIIRHQIDFARNPLKHTNLMAYQQLCALMRSESFDLVHCHTPMGGLMARLAAHATKTGPVIYTAHGFHFFDGAPPINWLCYYPVEKFLSNYTDQQICINQEDFSRAKQHFHAKYVDYIPGVGFNFSRLPQMSSDQIQRKKTELGLPTDKFIILSTGELIKRKNHETAIRAIALLKQHMPNIHYVICGHGALNDTLHHLSTELHLQDNITFLGYREDILEIYPCADIFLFPSFQEGLPMALLEAMASGLPIVCSDIRGSRDLMETNNTNDTANALWTTCQGGLMIKKANDSQAYSNALNTLLHKPKQLESMQQFNIRHAGLFSSSTVSAHMETIYRRFL